MKKERQKDYRPEKSREQMSAAKCVDRTFLATMARKNM